MAKVNPKILTWARETAGLSLAEAAHAINLNPAHGQTGEERLAALERGQGEPTRPLLRRMVKKYRRPLLVFYLAEAPAQGDRGEDFRTLAGRAPPEFDPLLDALIREVRARHAVVKSLLEDDDPVQRTFVGSKDMSDGAAAVAKDICTTTGLDLKRFRSRSDVDDAFAYLRACLERSGIFVLLMGNLGSHHSNIGPRAFRGFAIADPIAPFIVINDQDARAAWSFTALHEAAHLWLGTSGVSGAVAEARIERFCNDVAGHILLPDAELTEFRDIRKVPFDVIVERISRFANARNISRRMVAYQLLRFEYIDGALWTTLNDRFQADWLATKAKSADKPKSEVSFYVVRRHRLGRALIGLVSRALSEGQLTYTKAGQVLGVKPRTVEPLLREELARGGV
jgi:Zn-dependent peptidase ImmA (M78 family)/transcriptional regulator with XRE-family HTH domain